MPNKNNDLISRQQVLFEIQKRIGDIFGMYDKNEIIALSHDDDIWATVIRELDVLKSRIKEMQVKK